MKLQVRMNREAMMMALLALGNCVRVKHWHGLARLAIHALNASADQAATSHSSMTSPTVPSRAVSSTRCRPSGRPRALSSNA